MDSKAARAALGLGVILVAIVLLVVLKDDDEGKSAAERATTTEQTQSASRDGSGAGSGSSEKPSKPSAPAVPTIVVKNGKPVGGVADLSFHAGDRVRFKVSSDAAEEIHLHGYDISKDVAAGGTVEFDFTADIEGVFEAELEHLAVQIAELRIEP